MELKRLKLKLSAKTIPAALPALGAVYLLGTSLLYAWYGITAFPRQEWLLEVQVSVIFLLPLVNWLRGPASGVSRERTTWIVGLMLLLHSVWDATHWPGLTVVNTPVDPRLPRYCPYFDIGLGLLLLTQSFLSRVGGRSEAPATDGVRG